MWDPGRSDDPPTPQQGGSERRRARWGLSGTRLLLVDDDPEMLEILGAALDGRGAEVVMATCAGDALRTCQTAPPDVVVSDIGMPGEDGCSFIRKMRALANSAAAAPAVALTAYTGADVRARAMRAGFDVFVTKPVDPEELIALVTRLAASARS